MTKRTKNKIKNNNNTPEKLFPDSKWHKAV